MSEEGSTEKAKLKWWQHVLQILWDHDMFTKVCSLWTYLTRYQPSMIVVGSRTGASLQGDDYVLLTGLSLTDNALVGRGYPH